MTRPPTTFYRHPQPDTHPGGAHPVRGAGLLRGTTVFATGVVLALYGAWRSRRRTAQQADEERRADLGSYAAGYANGYLDGLIGPEKNS